MLGVTPQGVRDRVRKGKLHAVIVGGVTFIDREQVEAQRAELLRHLDARDARGSPDHDPEEVGRLRAKVVELQQTVEGLTIANEGLLSAVRARLTPNTIEG